MRKKGSSEDEATNTRKRGRPAGRNRVPLTLEERRARNTQYERERRNEKSKAMAELAEAAGCEPNICAPELLAKVISQIQNAAKRNSTEDSIENLRRINDNLMSQITKLESQLMLHCPDFESNITDEEDVNDEIGAEIQPAKSSSHTRTRSRKTVNKRKRKNRSDDSDSQDSIDSSTGNDESNYISKRSKTQLETHREQDYGGPRRMTRSCSSSQSWYETRSERSNNEAQMSYPTGQLEFNAETNLMPDTPPTIQNETSLETADSINSFQAQSQLPLDFQNWNNSYYSNEIHQPYSEFIANQSSIQPIQEAVIPNEIPDDLGLLPLENLNFLGDENIDFITDPCDWLDGFINNTSALDNSGNNLVYS